MMKLSVCLATYNEEKNIKDCLESVKWADEIVVVDGRSTDKTTVIAGKYTDKVIVRENPLMFHINKQKAFDEATGDWILYLDADERVTPALKREIQRVITKKTVNGYWLPRKNIIFGKWIKNEFWHPDYQLRLFRKGKAFLPCRSVHEQPQLTGKAGYLKNHLVHENYRTVDQYLGKFARLYTKNDARQYLKKGEKVEWLDALAWPVREFLATFFARKAYRDGLHGLVLSTFQAFSAFVTFARLWEAQGFKPSELPLEDFIPEAKKLARETGYWLKTAAIDQQSSPVKKIFLRVKRKISK
jgi:glycosyltransferase involved in cell wall biosynthesis